MSAETPDITDPRIARARAMREAGAETAEIARACGVTVSTIYRWAEAHGFRVRDLEAAAWAASGRGVGAPAAPASSHPHPRHPKTPILGSDGKNKSCHDERWRVGDGKNKSCHDEGWSGGDGKNRSCHDEGWSGGDGKDTPCRDGVERREDGKDTPCHDEEGEAHEDAPEITPEQWGQMARSLKQRALALTEAGRLRQAEQALRLAERYDRMRASAPQPQTAEDASRYYDEMDRRLDRLAAHLRQQAGLKEGEDFTDAHRAALGLKPLPPEYGG